MVGVGREGDINCHQLSLFVTTHHKKKLDVW